MTFDTEWRYDCVGNERSRSALPQRTLGGVALAGVAVLCAWTICTNLVGRAADPIDAADLIDLTGTRGDKLDSFRGDKLTAVASVPSSDANAAGAGAVSNGAPDNNRVAKFDSRPLFDTHPLLDSLRRFEARYVWDFAPETFTAQTGVETTTATASAHDVPATPPQGGRVAQSAPPPALRLPPSRNASARGGAPANRVATDMPPERPSIFERLFGKAAANFALAYASPDDGVSSDAQNITGRYDRSTAVYDISAHKVYMPDGTTLEAHSGYGSLLDDPRHADAKDRGVTPPDIYDLEPRESLFHGVRALRLIPVDESKVFGRSGLLAHSFMLGPNGDSNGCVSFRDYDAFLQAYLNHEIKRLVVVARLD